MFEQKTKQLMDLDCIENVEQIDDLAAESITGSLRIRYTKNGQTNDFTTPSDNTRINLGRGGEHSLQIFNETQSWKYYDISLHNADTGNFLEYTHRSNYGAHSGQWTPVTIAHDEMKNWPNRDFYLNVVQK